MMKRSKKELIEIGKQWIEHAPTNGIRNPELVGWAGDIFICESCAGRILARGCRLSELADCPVWRSQRKTLSELKELKCDICEEIVK